MIALRLEPPIELDTPKGRGLAILFRDYGHDTDDLWTVVMHATGELWTFRNADVRATANATFGRRKACLPSMSPAKVELGEPGR